jgi:hypothetical protein
MPSPYRKADRPLRVFGLRTRMPWLQAYGAVVFALIFLFFGLAMQPPEVFAVVAAIAAVLPLLIVPRLARYRIAGGKGELRIFRDRIEIPDPFAPAETLRLPLQGLAVDASTSHVWINGVSFGETHLWVLSNGDARRVLSTSLFESEEEAREAYTSVMLARTGQLEEDVESKPGRDHYDDVLDRELRAFDP